MKIFEPCRHAPCRAWRTHVLLGLCAVLLLSSATGCRYYSFTGASIPSNLQTIAIPPVEDNSISPVPTLGRDLTDLLTGRFVEQTRLSLTTNEGQADALLSATIVDYTNEPRGVTGDERASVNRVSVRAQVRYVDQTEGDEEMLARTFTGFGDYDPVTDGLDGERTAAQLALERLADDVFSSATSNW